MYVWLCVCDAHANAFVCGVCNARARARVCVCVCVCARASSEYTLIIHRRAIQLITKAH